MRNLLKDNYSGRRIRMQLIAVILTIILSAMFIPNTVINVAAEKIAENALTADTIDSADNNDAEEEFSEENIKDSEGADNDSNYIVSELSEKREESVKNFLLNDGTYLAVQYAEPVHYKNNDDLWADIDNSLEKIKKNGNDVYRNKSNNFTVELPGSIGQGSIASIAKDGYKLSFDLLNYNKNSSSTIDIISTKRTDVKDEKISNYNDYCVLRKIESSVFYESVLNDVDFEYILKGNGLKENIVVNRPLPSYDFNFSLSAVGLTLQINQDGSISATNAGGEEIFYLPAPYMYDAEGITSYEVHYLLETVSKNEYVLKLIPNSDWINNAAFPVVIDPVVYTAQNSSKVVSATIGKSSDSAANNINYHNLNDIYLGRENIEGTNYDYYGLLKFTSLPINEPNYNINDVTLILNSTDSNYCVHARYMPVNWNRNTSLTWNSLNFNTNYNNSYEVDQKRGDNNEFKLNITDVYLTWINTGINYGLILLTDQVGGSRVNLYSERSGDANKIPQLMVKFSEKNIGYKNYYSFLTNDIGNAGQSNVNLASGNLFLVNSDISLEGNLLPLSINHYYNNYKSYYFTKDSTYGKYGHCWGLNVDQKLYHVNWGTYIYVDNTGAQHMFYNDGQVPHSVDMDGVGLTLTLSGNSRVLTDTFNNKLIFDGSNPNGTHYNSVYNLKQIIDNNGNKLNINYNSSYKRINSVADEVGRTAYFTYDTDNYLANIRLDDPSLNTADDLFISYNYTNSSFSEKFLTSVDFFDGSTVTYQYTTQGLLKEAKDNFNYGYKFSYNSKNQVTVIKEFVNNQTGKLINISYNTGNKLFYNECTVQNGYYDNDINTSIYFDNKSYYIFDNFDRMVLFYESSNNSSSTPEVIEGAAYVYSSVPQSKSQLLYAIPIFSEHLNIIKNSEFDNHSQGSPGQIFDHWQKKGVRSDHSTSTYINTNNASTKSVYISETSQNINYIYQTISTADLSNDRAYVLSGWSKKDSYISYLYGNYYYIEAIIVYKDNKTNLNQTLSFKADLSSCTYLNNWVFGGVIIPSANTLKKLYNLQNFEIQNMTIRLCSKYAYFDNISLYALPKNENTLQIEEIITAEYLNNKRTSIMAYTSNNKNNLASYIDSNGVVHSYNYDNDEYNETGYGNVTDIFSIKSGKMFHSYYNYSSNGNYLTSTGDARGVIAEYTYDDFLGLITTIKDANGNITNYNYNTNRTLLNSISNGNASISYTYSGTNRISSITEGGTTYNILYDNWGNIKELNIENGPTDIPLIKLNYSSSNHNLSNVVYGSGNNEVTYYYLYDSFNRVIQVNKAGLRSVEDNWVAYNILLNDYTYNNRGLLTRERNYLYNNSYVLNCTISANYTYDDINRLFRYNLTSSITNVHPLSYYIKYDEYNKIIGYYSDASLTIPISIHEYNEAMQIISYSSLSKDIDISYDYDAFGRMGREIVKTYAGANVLTNNYTYWNQGVFTTNLITAQEISVNQNTSLINYVYDDLGNLVDMTRSIYIDQSTTQVVNYSYEYDNLNRLIRENNSQINITHTYEYDDAGNILCRNDYAYTTGDLPTSPLSIKQYYYTVQNNWKLLTGYNSAGNIEYDTYGNPTSYRANALTWQGRQLMKYGATSFRYNANGVRVQKGGNYYTYDAQGRLAIEKGSLRTLQFIYGETGIIGFKYNSSATDTTFYFAKNILGDVIAIYKDTGELAAVYEYDAYGKTTVTKYIGSIGDYNPIRYRGYYYDTETSLYYLNSRYYDPETGRFINADDASMLTLGMDTLGGTNLFAYCLNNPVNDIDPSGEFVVSLLIAIGIGAIIGGVIGGLNASAKQENLVGGILSGALIGAALGAATFLGGMTMLAIAGKPVLGLAIASKVGFLATTATIATSTSFLAGMGSYAINKSMNNQNIVASEMLRVGINTGIQGGIAFITGLAMASAGAYNHLLIGSNHASGVLVASAMSRGATSFFIQYPWRKALR